MASNSEPKGVELSPEAAVDNVIALADQGKLTPDEIKRLENALALAKSKGVEDGSTDEAAKTAQPVKEHVSSVLTGKTLLSPKQGNMLEEIATACKALGMGDALIDKWVKEISEDKIFTRMLDLAMNTALRLDPNGISQFSNSELWEKIKTFAYQVFTMDFIYPRPNSGKVDLRQCDIVGVQRGTGIREQNVVRVSDLGYRMGTILYKASVVVAA